jgi:Ca2+-binding EF-hand superfamily protein
VLRRSFQDFDPYYTYYLLRDEFEEVLRELCPELNKQEMEYLCSKHENPNDGRINYMDFLAPYAPRRNREKPSDSLKNDDQLSSRLDMNDTLTIKLRMRVRI